MKLSDLVAYKNYLDTQSIVLSHQHASLEINKITHAVSQIPLIADRTVDLVQQKSIIDQGFNDFENQLNKLKEIVKKEIELAERPWFQESYRLYDEEMRNDSVELILNRRPVLSEEAKILFNVRLAVYCNSRHPGLIIRPGLEDFIKNMVMFDPLYLVDTNHNLLTPALEHFAPEYQRRLRKYIVHEQLDNNILTQIPDNQIGLCFVYNFFQQKPFEIIKQYLTEIYQKLKPGGTLILTFNDCDHEKAVMLVERHFCCYTPGSLLIKLAETIGYEVTYQWNNNNREPTTWLEIKKPGNLTTLRGGQSLAKIMPK